MSDPAAAEAVAWQYFTLELSVENLADDSDPLFLQAWWEIAIIVPALYLIYSSPDVVASGKLGTLQLRANFNFIDTIRCKEH